MRPRTCIIALVAVAAVVVAAFPPGAQGSREPVVTAPEVTDSLALRWPAGRRLVYALAYEGAHRTWLPLDGGRPQEIDAHLDLDCDLALTPVPVAGVLRLEVLAVRAASMRWQETTLLDGAEAGRRELVGHPAWIELTDRGELGAVRVPPDAPELFSHVVRHLVGELTFRLGDGAWEDETSHGVARDVYRAEQSGDTVTIARTRSAYSSLRALAWRRTVPVPADGRLTATIAGGVLQSVSATERIDAESAGAPLLSVTTTLALRLRRAEAPRPLTGEHEALAAAPTASAPADPRPALLRRADGLDATALFDALNGYELAGPGPDFNRLLWRATALLRTDPALCDALAEHFAAPAASLAVQALIADLLAGAGTPEAQAALRRALAGDAARRSGEEAYGTLLQRLALVAEPDADTARFVETEYTRAEGFVKDAAACSLGAVAAGLRAQGDAEAAGAIVARLAADLGTARTPTDQVRALRALGNAGTKGALDAVGPFAGSEDPEVRRAVAVALRHASGEGLATLLRLAGDPDAAVQAAALEAASVASLSPSQVADLVGVVLAGGVDPRNDAIVVSFAARVPAPLRASLTEHLLSRPLLDPSLRDRLAAL